MIERALVTGASGVIGRALLALLTGRGVATLALDRAEPRFPLPPGVRFLRCDLADPAVALDGVVAGCTVAFHLAARMPQARLDEAAFHRENVEATIRLITACANAGVRRLVFASTVEVYGVQDIRAPLAEDDAKLFTGPYSHNKWDVEQRLLDLGAGRMETVALRMPMVFGPGFYHEKAMLALFAAVRLGLPVPVSAPEAPVSFVSSRDAAVAFMLAATAPHVSGEAFNVAAADHPSMLGFFSEIVRRAQSRSRPIVIPRHWVEHAVAAAQRAARSPDGKVPLLGTPAELVPYVLTGGAYSIDKARHRLGFAPRDDCAAAWIGAYRWFWSQPWSERWHAVRQRV